MHIRSLTVFCLLASLALNGCVSIDRRISTEDIDRAATQEVSGLWINRSIYGSNGRETMADAVGGNREAEKVAVRFEPGGGMSFEFQNGAAHLGHVVYDASEVSVDERGAIELKRGSRCRVEAAAACEVRVTKIFVNSHKEMVVVRSNTAAGAILVVPIVAHSKSMWTFIRRTGDPDLDDIPQRPQ